MDLESGDRNAGHFDPGCGRIKSLAKVAETKFVSFGGKSLKKLGKDDPRRIIHSVKVGLALTLVSLLFYVRPLYDGYGVSGMWAVLTMVVVFEFTVGGTLSRCINRGCATFVAAGLGVGSQRLAGVFPEEAQPIVTGILVFLLAAVATFTRFFPKIKARYDYGVVVFILTFTMVAVSGYRSNELLELARQRILMIVIGVAICVIISICLCPVWAGEDLHNMIALHMEKLAIYLDGFGRRYFEFEGRSTTSTLNDDKTSMNGYKGILVSKTTEEVLANFARWEMCQGQFQFRHPWEHYLRIGSLARKCAYQIEVLDGYVNPAVPASAAFRERIKDSCVKISSESSSALKIFAHSIKSMNDPSPANIHVRNPIIAAKELESTLKALSFDNVSDLSTIIPLAAVASILAQVANCVQNISEAMHEISQAAGFKGVVKPSLLHEHVQQALHRSSVTPVANGEECIAVVVVQEKDSVLSGN